VPLVSGDGECNGADGDSAKATEVGQNVASGAISFLSLYRLVFPAQSAAQILKVVSCAPHATRFLANVELIAKRKLLFIPNQLHPIF
jgi:hypothetical protein